MDIDLRKPYAEYVEYLQLLTEKSQEELSEAAKKIRPMWELKIGEFFSICDGDFACVMDKEPLLWQVLWAEQFPKFVEEFTSVVARLTLEPTPEQKAAAAGCFPMEWQEGILIFARSYFGLHSFAAVEELTLGDYILAKKHDYNTALTERNMHKQQIKKLKKSVSSSDWFIL